MLILTLFRLDFPRAFLYTTKMRFRHQLMRFHKTANFRAEQSDSDYVRLPLQTLHSAIAAAVVQSQLYMNFVQCIISRHFICDKKFL